mmetsp:Transcript_3206/g.7265  ORF Transcript_3206/g.7265 Transcript_3206/m.7265 type:complete len:346 (+) Transcript_3206:410-1447(+)
MLRLAVEHDLLVSLLVFGHPPEDPVLPLVEGVGVGVGARRHARPHGRHRGHRFRDGAVSAARRRAEHCRADEHRLVLLRQVDRSAKRVGVRLRVHGIFRQAAAREHGRDRSVPGVVKRVEDVSGLVRERLHGGEVEHSEVVDGGREREAHHAAAHLGRRERASVPREVGSDVHAASELVQRHGRFARQPRQPRVESLRGRDARRSRLVREIGVRGVRLDHVVEKLPRRGLTSFGEIEAVEHRREVRAPHAGNKDVLLTASHVAGGGAADEGDATLELRRLRRRLRLRGRRDPSPQHADSASMSIDHPHADGGAWGKTKLGGGGSAQTAFDWLPWCQHLAADDRFI